MKKHLLAFGLLITVILSITLLATVASAATITDENGIVYETLGNNLVANPSFEYGLGGAPWVDPNYEGGWTVWGGLQNAITNAGGSVHGNYAMNVTVLQDNWAQFFQTVYLEPGKTYIFSFWAKGPVGETPEMWADFGTDNNVAIEGFRLTTDPDINTWQQMTKVFNVPANAVNPRITVNAGEWRTNIANYFDLIEIYEIKSDQLSMTPPSYSVDGVDITAQGFSSDSTVDFSMTISNFTPQDEEDVSVILALYKNNSLVSIKMVTHDVPVYSADTPSVSFETSIDIPTIDDLQAYQLVTYVWNGQNLMPKTSPFNFKPVTPSDPLEEEYAGNLILHYSLNETPGNYYVTDATGNSANNSIYLNNVTFLPDEGMYGGSALFDGSSSVIALPQGAWNQTTTKRTVSLWFKANNLGSGTPRQILFDSGADNGGFSIDLYNGELRVGVSNYNADTLQVQREHISTPFTDTSKWHKVRAVFNNGELRLYLDDEIKASKITVVKTLANDSNGNAIGARYGHDAMQGYDWWQDDLYRVSYYFHFDGLIDDVRIYNTDITDSFFTVDPAISFSDISSLTSDQQFNIRFVAGRNIMGAKEGNNFAPNDSMTVSELTAALLTAYKLNIDATKTYTNEELVNTAISLGFIQDGEFDDYDKAITRAEAARLIDRVLDDFNIPVYAEEYIPFVDDFDTISDESLKAGVRHIAALGIIDNTVSAYEPNGAITRAEVADAIAKVLISAKRVPTTLVPNSLFVEHMVLQRGIKIPVWGTTAPNGDITISISDDEGSFNTQTVNTTADSKGNWSITFDATTEELLPPGGPYTLSISDGKQSIVYDDVLVGDVWIASGQSNMDFTGGAMADWVKEIELDEEVANKPYVRLYVVNKVSSKTPKTSIANSRWKVCSADTAASFSAVGYLFGRDIHDALTEDEGKIIPIGMIDTSYGGTTAQSWTSIEGLNSNAAVRNTYVTNNTATDPSYMASPLFNAMVNPLIPYGIKGVVWYQGESNCGQPLFTDLMKVLINDWRDHWEAGNPTQTSMPWIITQLPGFSADSYVTARESHLELYTDDDIDDIGLAVTIDSGDYGNIHPVDKRVPAERAVDAAKAVVYGLADEEYVIGPTYRSATLCGDEITVTFGNVGDGLQVGPEGDGSKLEGFEVCGSNGIWYPADADIISRDSIVVYSRYVTTPVAVRYLWMGWPYDESGNSLVTLYNSNGVPASPFRTNKSY